MADNGVDVLISDLRACGVIVDRCLGCKKIDCDGCPAGTGTFVELGALAPEVATKLEEIWASRRATSGTRPS